MSWQALLALHLLATTAFSLSYRRMASNLKGYGRIVTAAMYLGVVMPGGIGFALWRGGISFDFPVFAWGLIALVSIVFAASNFLSYRANEELDAAQFTIITNLQALFVIIIAGLFLGERLTVVRLFAALLLIAAAADVAVDKVGPRTFRLKPATLIALGSSLCVATAFTIEKTLLGQMSFSTYVIVSWPAQTLAITLFALRDKQRLNHISKQQLLEMLWLGGLRLVGGLSFVAALRLTEASVLASARSYRVILIFIAAYIFLGEKRDIKRRVIGAVMATVGLLLLI